MEIIYTTRRPILQIPKGEKGVRLKLKAIESLFNEIIADKSTNLEKEMEKKNRSHLKVQKEKVTSLQHLILKMPKIHNNYRKN